MKLSHRPDGLDGQVPGDGRRQPWGEAAAFVALAVLLAVVLVMILPLG